MSLSWFHGARVMSGLPRGGMNRVPLDQEDAGDPEFPHHRRATSVTRSVPAAARTMPNPTIDPERRGTPPGKGTASPSPKTTRPAHSAAGAPAFILARRAA